MGRARSYAQTDQKAAWLECEAGHVSSCKGYTWVFPKIGVGPPNHPFVHRVFHYFSPSILGVKSSYFWRATHLVKVFFLNIGPFYVASPPQESRLRMELASSRTRQNNDHPECLDCMNGILAGHELLMVSQF